MRLAIPEICRRYLFLFTIPRDLSLHPSMFTNTCIPQVSTSPDKYSAALPITRSLSPRRSPSFYLIHSFAHLLTHSLAYSLTPYSPTRPFPFPIPFPIPIALSITPTFLAHTSYSAFISSARVAYPSTSSIKHCSRAKARLARRDACA